MATYLTDREGKFIPATQRPDGTWRKARRIKDGYVPQEEIPLYESKGKLFAKKPSLPPGFGPSQSSPAKDKKDQIKKDPSALSVPGVIVLPQNKPNYLRERSSTLMCKAKSQIPQNKEINNTKIEESNGNVSEVLRDLSLDDQQQEKTKKLKRLRKKLREIDIFEYKLKSGEIKKPDKDQLDKVKRKSEILEEIEQLESDS